MLEPEFLPVTEELEKVAGAVPTRDQEDFTDPGIDQSGHKGLSTCGDARGKFAKDQIFIDCEAHWAGRRHSTAQKGCRSQGFVPAEGVRQLCILQHTILDRQDTAHLEMADAFQRRFSVIGLHGYH